MSSKSEFHGAGSWHVLPAKMLSVLMLLSLLLTGQGAAPAQAAGTIRYVTRFGVPNGACLSWGQACALQGALTAAQPGDQLWVQHGIYTPSANNRAKSFQLKNRVRIFGGFVGTEPGTPAGFSLRNPGVNATILSGNIGDLGTSVDNSFHVVYALFNTDSTAVLDGFTIAGGNANGGAPIDNRGGGLYSAGSPTLTNLTFSGNAAVFGGGMSTANDNSGPDALRLTKVTFSSNTATHGGALYDRSSNLTLVNVTFSGNSASNEGGAISIFDSSPTLRNVTISGNSATNGGAIANDLSSPGIYDSILWGNSTVFYGDTSATIIVDSIVSGGCPSGASCPFPVINANPLLGLLAKNGGYTQTRGLGVGSPAINAGGAHSTCAATDQRGITRPQGAACDIGAVEFKAVTITGNAGVGGATLSWTDSVARAATSAAGGAYSLTIPYGWSGTVTPSKANYVFAPTSRSYATVFVNQVNQNYHASVIVTVSYKSLGGEDGWVLESTATSSVGGTMNATATTFNLGDDAGNRQYRGILSFDTSPLPDNAVLISVTLQFRKAGLVGTNPFPTLGNILVDVRRGAFGGASTLELADFQAAASQNAVLNYSNTPVSWYSKGLAAANFGYIYKQGRTQFRLRFTNGDNHNLSADYLILYSGDAPAGYRPALIIKYLVP